MTTETIESRRTHEIISYDPATGEEIGRAPLNAPKEVHSAVSRARAAQPAWTSLSFRDRARIVLRARKIVLAELDEIAKLISRETGKPAAEAISMEMAPSLDLMHYFARHTARLLQPRKIDIGQYGFMGRSSQIIYKPLVAIGIISPSNSPCTTPLPHF